MRKEFHNLDGTRLKRCDVYDIPPAPLALRQVSIGSGAAYWAAVTNTPCPMRHCRGLIRWAEAGNVAGYRICDSCHRHFLAAGNEEKRLRSKSQPLTPYVLFIIIIEYI